MKELLIVGAGPGGISTAVEAIAAGISPHKILLLEKAHEHSFTIKKFYPEGKKVSANFKGVEAACQGVLCLSDSTKHETISLLDQMIAQYKLNVQYQETVLSIKKDPTEQIFTVTTDKETYRTRVVVIAIGILGKPNKPDYPLPITLKEKILFDVTSTPITNSSILVVGGGDSASEYCQFLIERGNRITLSYRKDSFGRMNEVNKRSLEELTRQGKVEILLGSDVKQITDTEGTPEVTFEQQALGTRKFDHVIYALGGTTPHNFLKTIGISFNDAKPSLSDKHETSVAGLFLVGDLSAGQKGGSIISAFNSAHNAMNQICTSYLECKVAG